MYVKFDFKQNNGLAGIPLKGDLLREFVQLLKEASNPDTLGITNEKSKIAATPLLRHAAPIAKKVSELIQENLSPESAATYGIDSKDLMVLLKQAIHSVINKPEAEEEIDTLFKGKEISEPAIKLTDEEKAQIYAAQNEIKSIFSVCLAVQENREADLLAVAEERNRAAKPFAGFVKTKSERERTSYLYHLAIPMVLAEQALGVSKERQSPTARLQEQILFGKDYSAGTPKKANMVPLSKAYRQFKTVTPRQFLENKIRAA